MSKAARKARKVEQREAGVKYQHPTRDGIPYGRSKAPDLGAEIAYVEQVGAMTRALSDHSRVKGFPDGGFR